MDHKSWPWKKISSHSNFDSAMKESGDEMHSSEKELILERTLESLNEMNEKIKCVINENEAKDELLSTKAKMLEEAIAGKEKAEKQATSLRQELDKALEQKVALNERLTQLNVALKESMQQLNSIREEHNQKIHNAVTKSSREFEKRLLEKSKNLANSVLENAHLNKALVANERIIEDLSKRKHDVEMGFNTLMGRLDLLEKENIFLKYEFRMMEKELDIRNGECQLHRQSAEVSRRQHMESLKKIKNLENECQRLRALVRKRSIAKMRDNKIRNPNEISNKKTGVLYDRLCDLEEENKTLKEVIARKDDELSSSLTLCTQSISNFSKSEARLEDLSKGEKITMELTPKSNFEKENRNFGVSDMSLMDDFVEMEKLAIVSVDDSRNLSNDNWLENVLKLIFDQNHVSKTSFDDLLEDIRISLSYMKSSSANKPNKKDPIAYITWKSTNSSPQQGEKADFENDKYEALVNQLRESEKTIEHLENEIENLKESKGEAEDQIVNQKLINEDLGTQLTVSKGKLNEVLQELSALEVELEDRSECYEELEGTCVELQLQLQSVNKEVAKDSLDQDEKMIKTGWEITAASAKLAECQETILNLGKQLKALATQNETSILDKKLNQRLSLRDRMLAEDGSEAEDPSSPKTKEIVIYKEVQNLPIRNEENEARMENNVFLAIIPSKKRGVGVGFWRKLLSRKKREGNKKAHRLLAV